MSKFVEAHLVIKSDKTQIIAMYLIKINTITKESTMVIMSCLIMTIMLIFYRIQEHIKAAGKLREEDNKEGEELKKLAVQFQIEKERLENIKRDERHGLMKENVKQIQDVEKMKILQERQDEVMKLFVKQHWSSSPSTLINYFNN